MIYKENKENLIKQHGLKFKYPENIPERGKEIVGIDKHETLHFVYLCKRCGKEWRSAFTGSGMMINIDYWKYCNEEEFTSLITREINEL